MGNINAVERAGHFGINADRAVNYHADKRGTAVVFDAVARSVSQVRSCAPLAEDWSEDINKDYEKRKKKSCR